MFMRSDRLFLRPFWSEDAPEVMRVMERGVMSNVAPERLSAIAADPGEWIADEDGRYVGMLITLPSASGSELIGGIGLVRGRSDVSDDARLGYWLSQDRWGHGYAAEAARGMLAIARTLGLRRIYADQSVDDRGSLLVLTRAGFRPTGEQRMEEGRVAAIYVAEIAGTAGDDRTDEVRAA